MKSIQRELLSGGDGKGQPVTLSLFGFPFHFLVNNLYSKEET